MSQIINDRPPVTYHKKNFFQRLALDFRQNKMVYLMWLPVLAFYLIFHYAPMGGLVIAFQDYKPFKGIAKSKFVCEEELELKKYGGYLLSFNGARIVECKTGEVVYQRTLPLSIVPGLYEFAKENGCGLITYQGPGRSGQVVAIVVPGRGKCFGLVGRHEDFVIPWKCITQIGDDIILIDGELDKFRLPRPRKQLF